MDGSTTITRRTYGCTGVETRGVSSKTQPLQLIHADACGEADGRPQAHPAAVPEVAHSLHGHQCHACDAAHGEDGAARARGQGHELPERVVHGHGGAEHVDGRLDKGHVVHDGRGDAEQTADEDGAVTAEPHQELGVALQNAGGVQGAHCQQHAGEEQQAREVHLVQRVDDAAAVGARRPRRALRQVDLGPSAGEPLEGDGVRHEPQDPEGQQHAEVRREARGHLQHRDQQDARHAQDEHRHLPPGDLGGGGRGPRGRRLLAHGVALPRLAANFPPQAQQGQDRDNERWQEEPRDGGEHADLVGQPQHRRGDIPDGAPGAAGVGGDDQQAADHVPQLLVVGNGVPQQLQAHDRGGQVVDHGAQEEAHDA
mmetsp:Transcript_55135/g.152719  ORF Transcript_55135/g.152719 Transcript_55135/m.152719 type:complete len:369 (+) Transcript_55135:277-1383(+)